MNGQRDQITVRATLRDQMLGEGDQAERDFDRKRLKTDLGYRSELKAWLYCEVDSMLRKLLDSVGEE